TFSTPILAVLRMPKRTLLMDGSRLSFAIGFFYHKGIGFARGYKPEALARSIGAASSLTLRVDMLIASHDTRERLSAELPRPDCGGRGATARDPPGGRLVRRVDSRGADGARVRLGAQSHLGRGDVAAIRFVSRFQPHR